MATLLTLTPPELVTGEKKKLTMNCIERTGTDKKVGSHEDYHQGRQKGTAVVEGRSSRARKGKNGHKKQSQRGLGVAQLEKLRLQEKMSKQGEAAGLASLQILPPFAFGNHRDKGSNLTHHGSNNGSVHLQPSDKLSDLLATASDKLFLKTIMSLVHDPFNCCPTTKHGHHGPLPSIMLSQHEDSIEPSVSMVMHGCSRQDICKLTSLDQPSSTEGERSSCTSSCEDTPERVVAPCALACLGSPCTTCANKPAPLFSNVLKTSKIHGVESQMLNVKEEKRARKENGTMELDYLLPAKNGFLEAGVPNSSGGVILESMSKDTGEALFTLTSLQCFESLLGSGNVGASNVDRPKELSSFQSFSSNQQRPTLEKSCGQKRPLHALKESSSKLLHSKSLDLNVPAGENDAGNKDGCSCCVAHAQDGPVGTYYTTGINCCSYPVNSELKLEVNGHQAQCVDGFSKMKQIAIFSEGDKEKLQLQMCNTYQGLTTAEGDGPLTFSSRGNMHFGGMVWELPVDSQLSCRLPSFSSCIAADNLPNPSGRVKEEDLIDLRLKLAL